MLLRTSLLCLCLLAAGLPACDRTPSPSAAPDPAVTATATPDPAVAAPSGAAAADPMQGGGAMKAPPPSDSGDPTPPAKIVDKTKTGEPVYSKEILSRVHVVDKIYKSMQGPYSTAKFGMLPDVEPELLWIVGFEAVMVSPEADTEISQDFMCHANLDFDANKHNERFADNKPITDRLFTLSQGQSRIDMPHGFGLPVLSDEDLSLAMQALNLNIKDKVHKVRHRIHVRFVRDKDTRQSYKALYPSGAFGMKLIDGKDGYYELASGPEEHHGPGCLAGQNASQGSEVTDSQGRRFTGHWVVKPGREENRTLATKLLALPNDTTIHYIAVHLHPFAESLTLRDITTGKDVWTAKTRQSEGRIGLEHVDHYSSEEGLPLYKDHEYEIISVYENTSGVDQDSMAVMNMYLLDKSFKNPVKKKSEG